MMSLSACPWSRRFPPCGAKSTIRVVPRACRETAAMIPSRTARACAISGLNRFSPCGIRRMAVDWASIVGPWNERSAGSISFDACAFAMNVGMTFTRLF